MPLDSVTVSALTDELKERISGCRIDKVRQPERDTLLLNLHGEQGSLRLAVCGGVGCARVNITQEEYENPSQPPMFCMLMRKHLTGAKISEITQPERERIIIFELDAYDEMKTPVRKRLAVEMMGRASNIVLIGSDGIIIDCLRRVDSDMNAGRQLLPGLIYRTPARQERPDFFSLSPERRRELWLGRKSGEDAEEFLRGSFSCLSPLICRELAYRAGGEERLLPACMDALSESVLAGELTPYMLVQDGRPKDFSFMRIAQYGDAMQGETFPSFNALLDAFYTRKSRSEDLHRRTQTLRKAVKNARDRAERKTALQLSELKNTETREQKRRWADLITANLYRIRESGDSVTLEDFYEEDCPAVTIPMDRLKTPQQNAARYYKEYTRLRTAREHLTKLIEESRRDAAYLDSVLDELERVQSESDIAEIRRELADTGYVKQNKGEKKRRESASTPLGYVSNSGFEILVGRSNTQNDLLTFKTARKGDIWLHVKDAHGSHVIIRCDGSDPDAQTLAEAASLAVLHSQASGGGKTPVDYTRVRFVKKPSGALPGMVIYTDYSTIFAQADENLAAKLKQGRPARND